MTIDTGLTVECDFPLMEVLAAGMNASISQDR